jgi:hypothetical protein
MADGIELLLGYAYRCPVHNWRAGVFEKDKWYMYSRCDVIHVVKYDGLKWIDYDE